MKHEADKMRKQQSSGKVKPVCGTLSYLAECRRSGRMAGESKGAAPPADMNRIIRK